MKEYACNYSFLRFLPYRDGGEFVNVGIVLACASNGYFDFRIEAQRWARVSHFFPEMEIPLYRAGLLSLRNELERWQNVTRQSLRAKPEQRDIIVKHVFGELTRAKEGIFYFAEPRTVLTDNPAKMLDKLFQLHIHRKFHAEASSKQQELQQKIADNLRAFNLDRLYRPARIGSLDYHINLPFVAAAQGQKKESLWLEDSVTEVMHEPVLKAITPLNLDREDPSEIIQRGDEWIARIRRLDTIGHKPHEWLFVIRDPRGTSRAQKAALTIREELSNAQVNTVSGDDTPSLIDFARLANP